MSIFNISTGVKKIRSVQVEKLHSQAWLCTLEADRTLEAELSEFEARLLVVTSSRPGTLTLFQKKTKFKKKNNKMKFSHKERKTHEN